MFTQHRLRLKKHTCGKREKTKFSGIKKLQKVFPHNKLASTLGFNLGDVRLHIFC